MRKWSHKLIPEIDPIGERLCMPLMGQKKKTKYVEIHQVNPVKKQINLYEISRRGDLGHEDLF
jgi:hypothetical protein